MTDRRTLWLALGCVAFAAAIVAELQNGGDVAAVPTVTPAHAVSTLHPPPRRSPPETLTATALARPLFSATRRPPLSDAPASAELAGNRLAGIVISPQQRLAIFAVTGAKPLVLKEGADIGGWRIEAITPYDVSLRGPGGTRVLRPRMDAGLTPSPDRIAGGNRAPPPPPAGARLRHDEE